MLFFVDVLICQKLINIIDWFENKNFWIHFCVFARIMIIYCPNIRFIGFIKINFKVKDEWEIVEVTLKTKDIIKQL